ncbi:MAG: hypothetical protein JSS65_11930 [Armatimonadetes bacterium]|nr:hypothetical protein [Armatimonadota bacterium]
MLDKEILRKLADEQPLTAAESLRLDEALESERPGVSTMLDSLEDVSPSYAWRSSLNLRLAATRRAPRLKLLLGWTGGLTAVAASVMALMMVNQPKISTIAAPAPQQTIAKAPSSLEEALVSSHMQGTAQSSIGAVPVQGPEDQVFDWSKLDKS